MVIYSAYTTLIDFLLESKMCITNGRITPELDDFTSKERSVVDYIIVPHDMLLQCSRSEVTRVNTLMNEFNLFGLIGNRCKPPDHALLVLACSLHFQFQHDENDLLSATVQQQI